MVTGAPPATTRSPTNKTGTSLGRGVIYIGHPYDVGVKLGGTDDRVILVAKDFEDVQPPGMQRQACEAAAGCPGYIDELDTGLCWPSMFPLERKGWYLFHPRPAPQGFGVIMENILRFLEQVFKARADPTPKRQ
ncbi:g5214 [Coccomyxa viridis]|uniref:G5214 protein n=1 Tax=Coccomyxa viridis TaxID=1274662 RepID=A0ABP1FS99_9CHLO